MKTNLPLRPLPIALSSTTLPRLLAFFILIALASCGGSSGGPAGSLVSQNGAAPLGDAPSAHERSLDFPGLEGAAAQPTSAPGGAELPSLAELDKMSSAAPGQRVYYGELFNTDLPNARVQPASDGLDMSPVGSNFSESSFAIFTFSLPDFEGPNSFEAMWTNLPDAGQIYFGISDYANSRWSWFEGHSMNKLELPGAGEYRSAAGNIHVVVLLVGSKAAKLSAVRWGGNALPTAVLKLNPTFCDTGTEVLALGFYSLDEDTTIIRYEFDLDQNGTYEVDNGEDTVCTFTSQTPGPFEVGLRVTDSEGLTATATATVVFDVPGYDEEEHNDSSATANDLPLLCRDFEGSLGPSGFDGDLADYYRLTTEDTGRLHINALSSDAFVFLELYDASGTTLLARSRTFLGDSRLTYISKAPGSYILVVSAEVGTDHDYVLNSYYYRDAAYTEIENNDSSENADFLLVHNFDGLIANLGAEGYDGDSSDWFSLIAEPGHFYFVVADFDPAAVDIDISLYDENLTLLQESNSVDSYEQVSFSPPALGVYYINCVIEAGSPAEMMGDYTVDLLDLGEAPTAALEITPPSGELPLVLSFDGSASQPGAGHSLASYFWDINESAGNYDYITGAGENIFEVVIYAPGTYDSMLTVQQANSAFAHAYDSFTVTGTADEVEPNDTVEAPQVISLPVTDFIGALGPGVDLGGSDDIYSFTPAEEGSLNVLLDYEVLLGPMIMGLYDSELNLIASDENPDGQLNFATHVFEGETLYLMTVTAPGFTGITGYSLDMSVF